MPPKGKCQTCGEYGILFGTLLQKKGGSELYLVMCCRKCREYFTRKREEEK